MPNIEVQVGAETDVGMIRDHNEDNLGYRIPTEEETSESHGMLFLVADGMGGHAAGEVASQIAVDTILERFFQQSADDVQEALNDAIVDANRIIHAQAADRREQSGMGTTTVVAVLRGDELTVANVGDSRAYLIRNQEIRQITQDHSWVNEQVRLNLVTPEEAKHHPLRNIITRALGTASEVKADFTVDKLASGDVIILCSDGLSGVVKDEEILRIVTRESSAEMAAKMLINAANSGGGPDNISTIVIRIDRVLEGSPESNAHGPRRSQFSTTVPMAAATRAPDAAAGQNGSGSIPGDPPEAVSVTSPAGESEPLASPEPPAAELAPQVIAAPVLKEGASRTGATRWLWFLLVVVVTAVITAALVLLVYRLIGG